MKLMLNRDFLDNPVPPRIFLCNTGKKRIQELQATNRQLNGKWSTYSEFSFETSRTYVDMLSGETKIHPAYDKIEVPRNVYVENYGYFALQDVDDTSGDNDIKTVSAFSLEYATSNKYLTNWYINTGEVDSKEVLYNESQFGLDYSSDRDSFYKFASGDFNEFESYYKRNYTDSDSYTYEQIQVANEDEYNKLMDASNDPDGQLAEKLYVKNYPNVQFYNESRKGLSLLHLIFEHIPEWEIGNVDSSLWHKERRFSEDRISVYDFLMNNVAETFGCTFIWDSIEGKVHVYESADDDDEGVALTRWETDVFVSKDNLASEVQVKYSADNIKTKLVVTGSDGLDIREVNLGGNSIMDLSFYHTEDWMERDLYDAYNIYLAELQEAQTGLDRYGLTSAKYPVSYPDAMKGWVAANNRYHELMHAMPTEENVLLVGDEFKKLFCVYSPIDTAYAKETIGTGISAITTLYYDEQCTIPVADMKDGTTHIVGGYKLTYSLANPSHWNVGDSMIPNSKRTLIKKLNQYHVDEDTKANKNDNILLKLKNSTSDVTTIRIYDAKALVPSNSVIEEHLNYYTRSNDGTYSKLTVRSTDDFKNGNVYTNNYMIQSITVYAESGTSGSEKTYTLDQWLSGELTAKMNDGKGMDLEGYTVSYIGTMGAYFVLAKDEVIATDDGVLEVSENYLKSCGVNLLKEKHKVYTSIFQTQTEAMLSQEKYQCIVQDEPPKGEYKEGTRWLDSNDKDGALYEYKTATSTQQAGWYKLVDSNTNKPINATEEEWYNFENYQRYLDNYNKIKAVQKQLAVKEREAQYSADGYIVNSRIDESIGNSIHSEMERIAKRHLVDLRDMNGARSDYSCAGQVVNTVWPLYTFTTSYDPIIYDINTKPYSSIEQYYVKQNSIYLPANIKDKAAFDEEMKKNTLYVVSSGHTFAVYLKGEVPYVAYANSQGVYNMIMEYIRTETDMSNPKFFNNDQWIRLSPFIKEDEFNDSNFLLTGYESEEERISICEELMEAAAKELKTLCRPSLEFSMTMANILALPEFEPLIEQFQLGNFIRVGIRDGYVKRARLLEVNINFDDLSSFDCTFGNLKTAKSEIDKHADLLSQAVTAGKQVAKSNNSWQRTVEKANKIEDDINSGLQDAALKIKNASGQSIEIGENGLVGRKLIDGTDNQYEDEQVALINNKLVFTADNWNTSKSCFGKFTVDGQDKFGVLSDAIISGYIQGSVIEGGSLSIGGTGGQFIVNTDGSVQILGPQGEEKYTSDRFQVRLIHSGPTVFSDFADECIITCVVYDSGEDITQKVVENGGIFTWNRSMSGWTPTYVDGKPNVIKVKHTDIDGNSQIDCFVDFDETKFNTQGGASE